MRHKQKLRTEKENDMNELQLADQREIEDARILEEQMESLFKVHDAWVEECIEEFRKLPINHGEVLVELYIRHQLKTRLEKQIDEWFRRPFEERVS
jgi:hypothetical protein